MSDIQSLSTPLPGGAITDVTSLNASPVITAKTVARIFGQRAATIAAWCAVYARQDGDDAGYRLWFSTFKHLKACERIVQS